MTDFPSPNPEQAQQALKVLVDNTGDESQIRTAVDTLAGTEVLVPVPAPIGDEPQGGDDGMTLTLPVVEQSDGAQVVPVFTSEPRMTRTLPDIPAYRRVPLGVIAARWPTDELSLVVDAGDPDALALNAESVRTLLARR
ncbi:SseB family protein [Streptomyces himalayensis]|uniref:SseB family protein n=1 Tax=Streptomyces himalayensis subsp. himalayensis TaxID=2756131 RepID=A0A7W0I8A6_9ACTN|nr:SseB family protein [Streptomyces himalayensis]MBA2946038.1 SseB family protein [Streptomyces himalayensis subsp. himalayensis]